MNPRPLDFPAELKEPSSCAYESSAPTRLSHPDYKDKLIARLKILQKDFDIAWVILINLIVIYRNPHMSIEFLKKPWSEEESLSCLDEDIRRWFTRKFKTLTPPQRYSFKLISEGKNVIITAPTGSGKTFSAFMVILSELFKLSKEKRLEDKVYCVYVSREYRKKGVMKAIINEIMKMAKGKNVFMLRLYVYKKNKNAIKAYEKIGMQKAPYFMYELFI